VQQLLISLCLGMVSLPVRDSLRERGLYTLAHWSIYLVWAGVLPWLGVTIWRYFFYRHRHGERAFLLDEEQGIVRLASPGFYRLRADRLNYFSPEGWFYWLVPSEPSFSIRAWNKDGLWVDLLIDLKQSPLQVEGAQELHDLLQRIQTGEGLSGDSHKSVEEAFRIFVEDLLPRTHHFTATIL
jgi:hypothetical protein